MLSSGLAAEPPSDFSSTSLLLEDDNLLRKVFFKILQRHHPKLAEEVDEIFGLSRSWCDNECINDFDLLAKKIENMEPSDSVIIASCFSHNLNLHNLTEEATRLLYDTDLDQIDQPLVLTSTSMKELAESEGFGALAIYHALCNQSVELVFTAHPTQALRRELVSNFRKMQNTLERLHHLKMTAYEKEECLEQLQAHVQVAWRTDEIHRRKPTPQDEMRAGLSFFEDVIFPTLPKFYNRLDSCLAQIGQPRLPLTHTLFKFGSWMGGDRDGNPNVTHDTTRDVCIIARLAACDVYFKEVEKLMFEISVWRADDDLRHRVDTILANVDDSKVAMERKRRNYADFWNPIDKREPFRVVLSDLRDKLYRTREILHNCLPNPSISVKEALEDEDCISDLKDLTEPLLLMYNSLINTKDDFVANGNLLDLIRQVYAFGLGIVRLDIRQEATRHTEVINCITEYLNMGCYNEWDEKKRLEFLIGELKGNRPLLPPSMPMFADIAEVVSTFRMLANLPSDSLGAYVISMSKSASDVLAVMLLQRECGVKSFLRVVPLFETLTDLDNAPTIMRRLFADPWYHNAIGGKQECMIGYSDSGKDAGRLAAAWALYQVQLKLVAVAEEFDIHLALFHGRGGTVGRGGGPAHIAIKSQPPGTIKGSMRVTIQGEIINQQFGGRNACLRTLDLYTSAVLDASLCKACQDPRPEWTQLLSEMAEESCKAYRSIVFQDPNFATYFKQITPVQELAKLNIGSRPAARKKTGGVETLRAIPWIFAWNQTRFVLPVWLGLAEAFTKAFESGKKEMLMDMYKSWTFFKVTIDLVEMVVFKADPRVVAMYDQQLVEPELKRLGADLTERFHKTKQLLSDVTEHGSLGLAAKTANPLLYQKLKLRAAYLTPLSMLQIKCLKALRECDADSSAALSEESRQHIEDALIITIKGVAAGVQNTG